MSETTPEQATDRGNPIHMIAALGGVAMLSGLLVVFVYQGTLPRILANREAALQRAVLQVLPAAASFQTYGVLEDGLVSLGGDQDADRKIYAGYDSDGEFVGVALEAEGQGYQGVVRVLYGYSPKEQCITGIVILQSTETPGLGDKIGKDKDFLDNFVCLDVRLASDGSALMHPVVVVKHGSKSHPWEIDGISGATISSRAVGAMLNARANEVHPLVTRHTDVLMANAQ